MRSVTELVHDLLPWVAASMCSLRLLYMLTEYILLMANNKEWTEGKKRRLFIVRIVSFTHAAVTGLGSILAFWYYPELVTDPYGYTCNYVELLSTFSMGYFLHDISDMFIYGEWRTSKEYITHHSLSLAGFVSILHNRCLYGVAMVTLLAEVHTVFLHSRTMMRLNGFTRDNSRLYCQIMIGNFVALCLFRHLTALWVVWYLSWRARTLHYLLRLFLLAAISFIIYHNFHLQYRLLRTEGYLDRLAILSWGSISGQKMKSTTIVSSNEPRTESMMDKEEEIFIDDEAIDSEPPPHIYIGSVEKQKIC